MFDVDAIVETLEAGRSALSSPKAANVERPAASLGPALAEDYTWSRTQTAIPSPMRPVPSASVYPPGQMQGTCALSVATYWASRIARPDIARSRCRTSGQC